MEDLESSREILVTTTDNGKKIFAVKAGNNNLLKIKYVPGGQLPRQWEGNWSDINAVNKVVFSYLSKQKRNATKKAVS